MFANIKFVCIFDISKTNNMTTTNEIREAVLRFISYIKMGWNTDESFEIAYDSVYDIIQKEEFLNKCQSACREMKQVQIN